MSLFGNPRYQYRETYFILFELDNRPTEQQLLGAIAELGDRYEVKEMHHDQDNRLESMTVVSPSDFAGLDLTYVDGDEVLEQVAELNEQFKTTTLTGDEMKKIIRIGKCRARFDVLHFEEVTGSEDDFLDPGSLLTVVEKIASICDGVGIDRESLTII
ncbi:MAG: hypothetical protein VX768_12430 [Planctomycetota bacterium]|nr:hypothetical protein [Planctomycetota bacterium]